MRLRSWKTTVSGIPAGLVGAILAIHALWRAWSTGEVLDPEVVLTGLGGLAFASTCLVGLFARDDDRTSEEVGAGQRTRWLP